MKKFLFFLFALALLFAFMACAPKNKNKVERGGNQNNPAELTITGGALDITENSATLTGFANLPIELGAAKVGIIYDKGLSFESARKVAAYGLDGNNKFTVTANGLEASTTYYYKSYVQNGMAMKYGAVKSFKTIAQRVTSISLDRSFFLLESGKEATLTVTSVLPNNANDKSYTWSSSDNAIASVDKTGIVKAKSKGTATIKATANDGSGVSAACEVDVYKIDVPHAVDMGIVVNGKNIKWASLNLGASSPEEYGIYCAWGETEPKSDYSWATYKWCNGSFNSLTKYNAISDYGTVDNKTILDSEDDVANAKLGGSWRMPTYAEWTELVNKCKWTWTTRKGVNGILVTAANGNSLFLPAAGGQGGDGLGNAGSEGNYWSSSSGTGYPFYRWGVYFNSGNVSSRDTYRRCSGLSVRPVSE